MVLRIEDTDVERSKQHHAEQILSSLSWLGVRWDEGPVYQSERLERYRERAEWLIREQRAYRCGCTAEELEEERRAAEEAGGGYRYSGRCRERNVGSDMAHVVRFRVPEGSVQFTDLIRGEVRFEDDVLDDFVLLRSDGNPTYHLSVVVDDIDMEITIVARGDDHLSNTPRHVLLFEAFGAAVPEFAHLPLILGSDRKRLSKRTGSTSTEEYQEMGILPQALFNFLALLGWSPGGDREIVSEEEAVALFDLRDVHKAAAVFDIDKLLWLNGQYIMALEPEQLEPHLRVFLPEDVPGDSSLQRWISLYQPRSRTLREMADQIAPYYQPDEALTYEETAVRKHLKGDDLRVRLEAVNELLRSVESFDESTLEQQVRALAEKLGLSAAKLIHPLRLALTGSGASPGIFDVLVAMGRERAQNRVRLLLDRLPELSDDQFSSSSTDQ